MSKRCDLCKGRVYPGDPVYLFAESEYERYGGPHGDTIHVVKTIEQVNDKEDADVTICGCCKDVIEGATWRPT